MTDISELQARITAALDRIGSGLEVLERPVEQVVDSSAGDEEIARLTAALEDERMASAQLEERVLVIKEKQDSAVARLKDEVERLRGQLASEESVVAKLSRVNDDLRANNAAMREAIAAGLAEPHLVNKSMMTELDALRAAHGADRAELEAVLSELGPMVAEARAGAGNEGEVADA